MRESPVKWSLHSPSFFGLGVASSLPSPSFGEVLLAILFLRFGDLSLLKVKDVGKSEPRASGVIGSWVVVSSVIGVMCPVAWVFRHCHCLWHLRNLFGWCVASLIGLLGRLGSRPVWKVNRNREVQNPWLWCRWFLVFSSVIGALCLVAWVVCLCCCHSLWHLRWSFPFWVMLFFSWFLCVVLFSPSSSLFRWRCLPPPLAGVAIFSLSVGGAALGGPTFQSFFGVVVLVYPPSCWGCSSLPPPFWVVLPLSPVLLGLLLRVVLFFPPLSFVRCWRPQSPWGGAVVFFVFLIFLIMWLILHDSNWTNSQAKSEVVLAFAFLPSASVLHPLSFRLLLGGAAFSFSFLWVVLLSPSLSCGWCCFPSPGTAWWCCFLPPPWGGAVFFTLHEINLGSGTGWCWVKSDVTTFYQVKLNRI